MASRFQAVAARARARPKAPLGEAPSLVQLDTAVPGSQKGKLYG